jgi:MarR family transcriptional regulator, temperature-dependent positive regulator of motility
MAKSNKTIEATSPMTQVETGSGSGAGFDPNVSVSHMLHRAQQIAADLHVASFGKTGLTQRQATILGVLGSRDGISQNELVVASGIDRSTMAEMVARMAGRGLLVQSKSATDNRANALSLTAKGQKSLEEAMPKLAAIDAAVLAFLPASRRETLLGLLTRIALPKVDQALTLKSKSEPTSKAKKKDKKKKERKKKKAPKVSPV